MRLMIKTAGICCILVSSMLFGILADREMRRKCMLLNEICELFARLEKEMTYHRAPIQESFRTAASGCSFELREVLQEAALQSGKRKGRSFREIWEEAVEKGIPCGLLGGEARQVFLDAAEALCNMDTVTQQTLLRKYADRFAGISRQEQQLYQKKGLLYRRLSAAAGVFFVILLI